MISRLCFVAVTSMLALVPGTPGEFRANRSLPATAARIDVVRVPDGGVQPEVVLDRAGVLHLVFLAGAPGEADVFYTRSSDGGRTFSPRMRVHSQPGSAIAMGTIRGAQLAVGQDGRVHVVWNGSSAALPKPPVRGEQKPGAPLLYARSEPGGARFEPQRNLITGTRHLDGGSSIAADDKGGVFVAWHGNAIDGAEGEVARRVWLSRSEDDGSRDGLPVWSFPAVAAPGDRFVVLY